uniref:HDC08856 n=1 Tax=Drosophila melanogaster TaxID=7227 RepID=Q6ILN5_DROME|nr:TPA_inf: HDC08856 [Drosophila melanogaster]
MLVRSGLCFPLPLFGCLNMDMAWPLNSARGRSQSRQIEKDKKQIGAQQAPVYDLAHGGQSTGINSRIRQSQTIQHVARRHRTQNGGEPEKKEPHFHIAFIIRFSAKSEIKVFDYTAALCCCPTQQLNPQDQEHLKHLCLKW